MATMDTLHENKSLQRYRWLPSKRDELRAKLSATGEACVEFSTNV